jgi:hypothetical protein
MALAQDTIIASRRDGDIDELLVELIDAHVDTIELFVGRENAMTRTVHLGYLQCLVRYSKRVTAHEPGGLSPTARQRISGTTGAGPIAAGASSQPPTDTCLRREGDLMSHTQEAAQDPTEPKGDGRRRWYHLRPESRTRADLMGINKTWWMALGWIALVALAIYPFPWWAW